MQGSFSEKVEIKSGNKVTIELDANTGGIVVKSKGIAPIMMDGGSSPRTFTPPPQKYHEVFSLQGLINRLNLRGCLRIGKDPIYPLVLDGFANKFFMRAGGDPLKNRVVLDGDKGDIWLGGYGSHGNINLLTDNNGVSISLNGDNADVCVGGNGCQGNIMLRTANNKNSILLNADNADICVGGNGQSGNITLNNAADKAIIKLMASTGDIQLSGADCAEDFNVVDSEQIDPGTVLVIDNEDTLGQSRTAYDKRAIGVVSGAGDCKPGITLNKDCSKSKRLPVALTGKVYCKVDADYSSIEVGDLLTTSPTPGHAMKADDPMKAFGAVIGKALHSLKRGRDLIPILVALQ